MELQKLVNLLYHKAVRHPEDDGNQLRGDGAYIWMAGLYGFTSSVCCPQCQAPMAVSASQGKTLILTRDFWRDTH